MKRFDQRCIALWTAGAAAAVACVVLIGDVTAAQPAEETWPPQFPREGATKLFENEHVIVWEQIGRPTEPFAHRHIRDILTFGVEAGPIEVLGPDLQPRTPSPGGSSFTERLYSRGDHTLSYSKAGWDLTWRWPPIRTTSRSRSSSRSRARSRPTAPSGARDAGSARSVAVTLTAVVAAASSCRDEPALRGTAARVDPRARGDRRPPRRFETTHAWWRPSGARPASSRCGMPGCWRARAATVAGSP